MEEIFELFLLLLIKRSLQKKNSDKNLVGMVCRIFDNFSTISKFAFLEVDEKFD